MFFSQLRKHHDDPSLNIDGVPIPVVDEMKFLGVVFVIFASLGADIIVLLRLYKRTDSLLDRN